MTCVVSHPGSPAQSLQTAVHNFPKCQLSKTYSQNRQPFTIVSWAGVGEVASAGIYFLFGWPSRSLAIMGQPGLSRKTQLRPFGGVWFLQQDSGFSRPVCTFLPTGPTLLFLHHYFLLIKLILKLWELTLITTITNWTPPLSPAPEVCYSVVQSMCWRHGYVCIKACKWSLMPELPTS